MPREGPCESCRESDNVRVEMTVHWGGERGDWSGEKTFCSWKCAAAWMDEMAVKHAHRDREAQADAVA